MIDTLFSISKAPQWPDELERLAALPRRAPFDPRALAFVGEVSARLLQSAVGRDFPELAALAHWFRPASLQRMKTDQLAAAGAQSLRPRGSVFIIAPANVDVLFIYGWMLSLLAGNATAARVSQKPSAARDAFLGLVHQLAGAHGEVLEDSLLISYPHDETVTARLSSWCDLRLIWGGDATVNAIRSIALKPTAIEGAFADRFSMAAFDSKSIAEAEDARLAELARRFANDTMWFGQQACSSPRIVFWIGSGEEVEAAQARFWPLFARAAERFEDEPAAMMARVTDLFTMAAEGVIDRAETDYARLPARARGAGPSGAVRSLHSGFGLFVEYRLERLDELLPFLDDKDQTLVVHGIRDDALADLLERLPNRALDRVVPIGQATDFAISWDGINLLDLLTRRISLPRAAAVGR
ncbi:MAG: hypothetical protein QOJ27_2731 [Sphingomonadales bacterium]|nr:hypothetical protein [Sphingomonadales bacterium]